MDIVWLGHSSFRIKGKDAAIVTDPFDPGMAGLKFPRVAADIVTVSHGHADHNNVARIDLPAGKAGGSPKVVSGAGEYEIKGVSIFGIPTFHDDKKGAERGSNTVYVMSIDKITVCHLGDLGHKLSEEQGGEIGSVDVLLVPVGGIYSLDSTHASEVVASLEPKVVIPMHYQIPGLSPEMFASLEPVDNFIKELGIEPQKLDKYVINYGSLPEEMQLVVLERKS